MHSYCVIYQIVAVSSQKWITKWTKKITNNYQQFTNKILNVIKILIYNILENDDERFDHDHT